jgi:hypothetical protein
MGRRKLDDWGAESEGIRLRVYFPGNGFPRVMVTTRSSRPTTSRAPCECDWELLDPDTGMREWVPGWYVATRVR